MVKIAPKFYNIFSKSADYIAVFQNLMKIVINKCIRNEVYRRLGLTYRDLSYVKRLQGNYEFSLGYKFKSLDV